jgi:Putative restriction endonuclease
MPTLPITERDGRIAPAEYLAAERRAATHSEYVNGKVYAMAGASREHVTIVANLALTSLTSWSGNSRDVLIRPLPMTCA